jgi:hypothetical protein
MRSPDWGIDDSGAVQGFIFFALTSISALAYVVIAFPLIAIKLKSRFSTRKWVLSNILAVVVGSYFVSCIFWYYIGTHSILSVLSDSIVTSIGISTNGLVLLAPAMFVWLRVAKVTHNTPLQPTPKSGASEL